jgi:hypothetical protein
VSYNPFRETLRKGTFQIIQIRWESELPLRTYRRIWDRARSKKYYSWGAKITDVPPPYRDGGSASFDARGLVRKLERASDSKEADNLRRQLAWLFAHDLPFLPLFEIVQPSFANADAVQIEQTSRPWSTTRLAQLGGDPKDRNRNSPAVATRID